MKTLAFINNNDCIENYEVTFDENELKNIQSEIDTWNGKGKLTETRTSDDNFFSNKRLGKKIEIVNKTFICDAYNSKGPVKINLYRYYEFEQCHLSILCDFIENSINNPIEFSMCLGELYNWDSKSKKENEFVKRIKKLFNYKKENIDSKIKSDIPLAEKKGVLEKIKKILLKSKDEKREILSSEFFVNELNKEADYKMKKGINKELEISEDEYRKVLKRRMVDDIPKIESM